MLVFELAFSLSSREEEGVLEQLLLDIFNLLARLERQVRLTFASIKGRLQKGAVFNQLCQLGLRLSLVRHHGHITLFRRHGYNILNSLFMGGKLGTLSGAKAA